MLPLPASTATRPAREEAPEIKHAAIVPLAEREPDARKVKELYKNPGTEPVPKNLSEEQAKTSRNTAEER